MTESPAGGFAAFHLLPSLLDALREFGYAQPTEIQQRAIPALCEGRSVVGVAETGSGKTLSYVLPILHTLKSLESQGAAVTEESRPRAVVIVPGRELGEQVSKVFKQLTHTTRLRVRTALGGSTLVVARRNVAGPFEVLVATPGRALMLLEREHVDLGDVRTLVFDEVDQMLDPGFLPTADRIVAACPPARQLALFSATVPAAIQGLIRRRFAGAEVIRSEGSHKVVPTLTTVNRDVINGKRVPLLREVLAEKFTGSTLIFANTRTQCDEIVAQLALIDRKCVVYRGEMDRLERRKNLRAFRDGEIDLLVATDLGARGIDVPHVTRVINYHLPQERDAYLHRVGRTARAGRKGVVINFVTERDQALLRALDTSGVTP